jgi:hypothetical protein
MTRCPFCKEEIQDDAIKCKHCQTMLVAIGDRADQSNTATYVVDQGLLRFGKFAGALLALFITMGVVLYGVNLEDMGSELDERADELDSIDVRIGEALTKLKDADEKTAAAVAKAEEAARSAEAVVAELMTLQQGFAGLTDAIAREFTRDADFVSEESQKRVDELLALVEQLPDSKALELIKNPPTITPQLKDIIAARDPANLAETDPTAARDILKMIVVLNDRDERTITLWKDELSDKPASP